MIGRRGVTLTDGLIACAVMGAMLLVTKAGTQVLLSTIQKHRGIELNQQVQSVESLIENDITNAHSVASISSDKLVLRAIHFQEGLNEAATFNEVNIGTITYQYVAGENPHLLRTVEFNEEIRQDKKMLRSILIEPGLSPFFKPVPDTAVAPFQSVGVSLRWKAPFDKKKVHENSITVRKINDLGS